MSTALSLMVGAASSGTMPQMVVDELEAVDETVTDTDAGAFLLEHSDEQVVGAEAARSATPKSIASWTSSISIVEGSMVETVVADVGDGIIATLVSPPKHIVEQVEGVTELRSISCVAVAATGSRSKQQFSETPTM